MFPIRIKLALTISDGFIALPHHLHLVRAILEIVRSYRITIRVLHITAYSNRRDKDESEIAKINNATFLI
jgi:hypothetical protein